MRDESSSAGHRLTSSSIALISLTMLCFAAVDTTAKYLVRDYHVVQVVWARYVFNAAFLIVLMPRHGVLRPFLSRRPGLQVARAAVLSLATLMFFICLIFMPLVELVTIGYTTPLILTVLAPFLLGERVGPRRLTAVAIGFLGVLIVMRPGAGVLEWPALLALAMAFVNATFHVLTRRLSDIDAAPTTLYYSSTIGAVLATLAVPIVWSPPDALGWVLMVGMGLVAGLGHFALIAAYERAPASALAGLFYTQMIWITLFGYLVFGDLPDRWTVLGAVVIIGSGLYVLYRESALRRQGRL